MVAPIPPATTKPAPSVPTATIGRCGRSLAATFVASPISVRRSSTASTSPSRSAAISRRTCSGVRLLPLLVAIAPQRVRRPPGLVDRLLRDGRCALLHGLDPEEGEDRDEQEER